MIGEGSFGRVFQYFNHDDGKTYAVKELNLEVLNKKIDDAEIVIKKEIELLSKINHKNIIKYYGSFKKHDKLHIILEYCQSGSLLSLLKKYKHFNESMIKGYITQILDGLEYLHYHNIIHRDIKCANILIGKDNICKLTDFGEAKIIKKDLSSNSSIHGTPNWMAPEIIQGLNANRFSDIWSIGCTVIEMFQGEPPYNDKKDMMSIMNCICIKKELPKIPKGMSDQLRDFVKKCLVFEPSQRYNIYELKRHKFIQGNDSSSSSNISAMQL